MYKYFTYTIVLIILSGCSLLEVTHDVEPYHDFSQYRDYAWLPSEHSIQGQFGIDNQTLNAFIHEIVDREMRQKSFDKRSATEAQFLVNYFAVASTKRDNDYQALDFSQAYRHTNVTHSSSLDARKRYTFAYEHGTIIIDIIDNQSQKIVWRGIVESPIGLYKTQEKQVRRLNKAVKKILKPFPPKR